MKGRNAIRNGRTEGDLLHDSAESLASYLTKQNRYTRSPPTWRAGRR
ncbi:MAG: hypothetical protein IPJ38_13890 [Dechloromonas sp.]|uniref:Uncharacterized protein n=1 Tax=Candidatus Dechloromonas phosphorivorans TaxID=2899244 RepID=A0A935MWN3_9RHOO|nr:hypothetical protein [Candidatus Dechloromonas phosphorivorans]